MTIPENPPGGDRPLSIETNSMKPRRRPLRHPFRRRSPLVLFLLLLFWSVLLGFGLAQAAVPGSAATLAVSPEQRGTVDVVPENFQLGQTTYLENCASCHVGLPPAVMPSQTWRSLVQEAQHYGTVIHCARSPGTIFRPTLAPSTKAKKCRSALPNRGISKRYTPR
jgi:mono/diheme cytochrome c family protein